MSAYCENLEKCGFFLNFKGNSEVIMEGWIKTFCESAEKSNKCQRKIYKITHGKSPTDNMTPTGKIIAV
jgi:hypothetical protein